MQICDGKMATVCGKFFFRSRQKRQEITLNGVMVERNSTTRNSCLSCLSNSRYLIFKFQKDTSVEFLSTITPFKVISCRLTRPEKILSADRRKFAYMTSRHCCRSMVTSKLEVNRSNFDVTCSLVANEIAARCYTTCGLSILYACVIVVLLIKS